MSKRFKFSVNLSDAEFFSTDFNGAKYVSGTLFIKDTPSQYGTIGDLVVSTKNDDGTYTNKTIGHVKIAEKVAKSDNVVENTDTDNKMPF